MQFTLFTSLALASFVLAEPSRVLERDLPTITQAVATVQSSVVALDTAVKAFNGINDAGALQMASANALTAINNAQKSVAATSALGLADATQLQGVVQGLTTNVNTLVTDLVAKKPTLDQAGVSSIVLTNLNMQKTASKALADTIVSKVPAIAQGLAGSLSQGVTDAINKGITAFQGAAAAPGAPAAPATPATPAAAMADMEGMDMSATAQKASTTSMAGMSMTGAGSSIKAAGGFAAVVAVAAAFLII